MDSGAWESNNELERLELDNVAYHITRLKYNVKNTTLTCQRISIIIKKILNQYFLSKKIKALHKLLM